MILNEPREEKHFRTDRAITYNTVLLSSLQKDKYLSQYDLHISGIENEQ